MSFWTAENIRASCAGTWRLRPLSVVEEGAVDTERAVDGISTDSRSIKPGQAFLALRGERFDGHQYLGTAIASGSQLLIVDDGLAADNVEPAARRAGVGIIRVNDTGKALLRLAGAYRRTLENTKVVAVVGSNGKTTASRLIGAVLRSSLRGTASAKSFNNSIGVPLTILSAAPSDQFLVCEVGTNAPGEVAQLASIVEPDIAVITSIGREHLEGFGSIQGVAREEASVISFLRPGGLAVVTADTPVEAPLEEYLKGTANIVRFGFSPGADLRASEVTHVLGVDAAGLPTLGLRFRINDRTACALQLLGEHNACNALAAFAVGRRFGLDADRVIEALAGARGPEMRLEPMVIATGEGAGREGGGGEAGVMVINDAYNANPDSMLAALNALADVSESLGAGASGGGAPSRVVAVLGDMMELGELSEASHREIGERVRDMSSIDMVVLVGARMDDWARPALLGPGTVRRVVSEARDDEGACERIAGLLRPGDLVLLKGSRRMRLERVVEAARRRWSAARSGPAICRT